MPLFFFRFLSYLKSLAIATISILKRAACLMAFSIMARSTRFSTIICQCILTMHFPLVAPMHNPSWLVYSTLRSLCILHGIEVQNVSRRTLYNWRNSGVDYDHIDLLRLRLVSRGFLSRDDLDDVFSSCGYSP